ncbi:group III truncated hemoglobin [Aurantimonas sp. A2-1-M11]|uniref:group III truncated hemoglobin n=1 Tax=Aurantimonas sp. A2-1-M11 TaxID=3113712 RepID=UPI002F92EB37
MAGERDAMPIVSEDELRALVDDFYDHVRADAVLGPVFERAVSDWPAHLERLTAFWSSVMLTSGRYKGNPFAVHHRHRGEIDLQMFDRWLGLWRETTSRRFSAETAAVFHMKAERIADSLKSGLFFRPELADLRPAHPVRT